MSDCLTGKDAPRVLYEAHASQLNLALNPFFDSRCSICQELKQKFGYTGVVNHKQVLDLRLPTGANMTLGIFHGRLQSSCTGWCAQLVRHPPRGAKQERFGDGKDLTYRIPKAVSTHVFVVFPTSPACPCKALQTVNLFYNFGVKLKHREMSFDAQGFAHWTYDGQDFHRLVLQFVRTRLLAASMRAPAECLLSFNDFRALSRA